MSFLKQHQFILLELLRNRNEFFTAEFGSNSVFPVFDPVLWKTESPQFSHAQKQNLFQSQMADIKQVCEKKGIQNFGVIVSTPQHVYIATQFAQLLYLSGDVCRQSDVLAACAQSGLPVVLEKGVFLPPNDMVRVMEKLSSVHDLHFVDCGSSYGYCDSVLDPRSLFLLQKTGKPFGVFLNPMGSETNTYSHFPTWLQKESFLEALITAGNAFGASFYVFQKQDRPEITQEICLDIIKNKGKYQEKQNCLN